MYGPHYAPTYPFPMSLDAPGPLKELLQETATREDDLVRRIDQLQRQLLAVRGTRRVAEEARRGIQELLDLPGIRQALRNGCILNAFKGGGGLRVVRLGTKGTPEDLGEGMSIAYGEHPHVEGALVLANEDFQAGGRPHDDVYGRTHHHYVTGSTTPSGCLDGWLLDGSLLIAWQEGEEVAVQLRMYDATNNLCTIKSGWGRTLHEAVQCASDAQPESAPEDWDEPL